MSTKETVPSALQTAVAVECGRRKWTMAELARQLGGLKGKPVGKQNIRGRIVASPPSEKTVADVALAFGWTSEQVKEQMVEEVARARAEGRPIGPAEVKGVVNLEECRHETE